MSLRLPPRCSLPMAVGTCKIGWRGVGRDLSLLFGQWVGLLWPELEMDSSCITPPFRGDVERKLREKKSSAKQKAEFLVMDLVTHFVREKS